MKNGKRVLNARALTIVGCLALVVMVVVVILVFSQSRYGADGLLQEAKAQLAMGPRQAPLALSYINRYLELKPNDLEALELKAQILGDSAQNVGQADEAI